MRYELFYKDGNFGFMESRRIEDFCTLIHILLFDCDDRASRRRWKTQATFDPEYIYRIFLGLKSISNLNY